MSITLMPARGSGTGMLAVLLLLLLKERTNLPAVQNVPAPRDGVAPICDGMWRDTHSHAFKIVSFRFYIPSRLQHKTGIVLETYKRAL